MSWDCALCGKTHEHWPDLAKDVHFPTRESALKMGFPVSPSKIRPRQADPAALTAMEQAALACKQRAVKCTELGLSDLAGAWTRCQADLESTAALRRKFDSLPGPTKSGLAVQAESEVIDSGTSALADRVTNLFTGKLEAPHESRPARKRGRR